MTSSSLAVATLVLAGAFVSAMPSNTLPQSKPGAEPVRMSTTVDKATVDRMVSTWKVKPKELAQKLVAEWGLPQEATPQRLIWHNNGPWKFSELVNEEIDHNFPVPHKDMLYQAINYDVNPKHAADLLMYDGSIILERTKGEMAARCDRVAANFLAINLAHDVASGRKSVTEARRFYAESMMKMMKQGEMNDYMKGFVFDMPRGNVGDPDKPYGPVGTSGRPPGE